MRPLALLIKCTTVPEIQEAAEQAARGESFLRKPRAESLLSNRERDVLRLCAQAKQNAEIARMLNISKSTVANNLQRIKERLQLKHRGELILYYRGHWHDLEHYKDKVPSYSSLNCKLYE